MRKPPRGKPAVLAPIAHSRSAPELAIKYRRLWP